MNVQKQLLHIQKLLLNLQNLFPNVQNFIRIGQTLLRNVQNQKPSALCLKLCDENSERLLVSGFIELVRPFLKDR